MCVNMCACVYVCTSVYCKWGISRVRVGVQVCAQDSCVCVCVCTGEGMVGYRRNSPPSDFIALTSFQTFIFLNSFI